MPTTPLSRVLFEKRESNKKKRNCLRSWWKNKRKTENVLHSIRFKFAQVSLLNTVFRRGEALHGMQVFLNTFEFFFYDCTYVCSSLCEFFSVCCDNFFFLLHRVVFILFFYIFLARKSPGCWNKVTDFLMYT